MTGSSVSKDALHPARAFLFRECGDRVLRRNPQDRQYSRRIHHPGERIGRLWWITCVLWQADLDLRPVRHMNAFGQFDRAVLDGSSDAHGQMRILRAAPELKPRT